MTTRLTATKRKFLFLTFIIFIFIAGAILLFFQFTENPKKDLNKLFSIDEIPRFDIKTSETFQKEKRDYTTANFELKNENFSGQIKSRGNSTHYAAKEYNGPFPYRIKFDEKKSLLGLSNSKSYVLLPNFIDPSSIRQFFHLNLASFFSREWAPRAKYVEVYLDDEYAGLYLLAETIGESEEKIGYKNDLGFIVEMDLQGKADIDYKPYIKDETLAIDYQVRTKTYLATEFENVNVAFELKDPDAFSKTSEEHKNYIINSLTNLHKNSDNFENLSDLKIDVDSFVDYFLIQEIFENYGAGSNSVYYWNDGEKMHAGPFWDADYITTSYLPTGFINNDNATKNPLYVNFMKNSEFKEKFVERFNGFYENSEKFRDVLVNLKHNEILKSAWQKNEDLYHRLSRTDLEYGITDNKNIESRKTFEEQVDYIIGFYFDGFNGETFWKENPEKTFFEPRLKWLKENL